MPYPIIKDLKPAPLTLSDIYRQILEVKETRIIVNCCKINPKEGDLYWTQNWVNSCSYPRDPRYNNSLSNTQIGVISRVLILS